MSQRWGYLSTTPPYGFPADAIKAVYQFDGPAHGLEDRTGNGHDLSTVSSVGHAWIPQKAEYGCNLFAIMNSVSWLYSANSALLGTLGAATLEFVVMNGRLRNLDDTYNGYLGVLDYPHSGTEAGNCVLSVYGGATRDRFGILIETGGGIDHTVDSPAYWQPGCPGHLIYNAITRAEDGVTYKRYVDGNFLEELVMDAPPTGGTNVAMVIGALSSSGNSVAGNAAGLGWNSVRWSHGEMTARQVKRAYYRLRLAS